MSQQLVSQQTQRELNRLFANAVLLNADGVIVAANDAWQAFAEANRCKMQDHGIGANYLDVCDAAADTGVEEARVVAAEIRNVANGKRQRFVYDYDKNWRLEAWQQQAGTIVAHFPVN